MSVVLPHRERVLKICINGSLLQGKFKLAILPCITLFFIRTSNLGAEAERVVCNNIPRNPVTDSNAFGAVKMWS